MVRRVLVFLAVSVVIYLAIALGLIASQRPSLLSVEGGLDFTALGASDTPAAPLETFTARDGTELLYRSYASGREGAPLLVFVHGSGWHGLAYDGLARRIAEAGAADVVLPDLRGHGVNPERRGDIDYIGQYEDDLSDLILQVRKISQSIVIAGHSSGGGLAIRLTAGAYGDMFAGAILIAPYVHHEAPSMRPDSGGWAQPFIRRIIGLVMLNNVGVTALNGLPVIQFAFPQSVLDGPLGQTATTSYSFRLNTSYAPRNDYLSEIAALPPFLLIAGAEDEAFVADRYEPMLAAENSGGSYHLLPGVSHLGVIDEEPTAELITEFLREF
ncbi:alpha/beta hydrolase [Oricola sp.]|uniref:alpha/beta hydrolase n=1 Tax=Oricola sp. TaxID=1979950 RepID=UPI003BA88CB1